jgi:hypothetical protein
LLYSNLMNVYQLLSTEFFQAKVPCDRRWEFETCYVAEKILNVCHSARKETM